MKRTQSCYHLHEDQSLLIQFIFSEYLEIAINIQQLAATFKKSKPSQKAIDESLHRLVGAIPFPWRIFSWNLDDSPLARLRNSCALFAEGDAIPKEAIEPITRSSHQLWLISLRCLELQETQSKEPVAPLAERMELVTLKLGRSLLKLVTHFSRDENVLYYLLRHSAKWNSILGEDTILKTIKGVEFSSINDLKKFLVMQYRKRQFEALIPKIEAL